MFDKEVRLPNPQTSSALGQLLNNRVSDKEFSEHDEPDEQTISDLLWSAFGKNKKGTRTIPTALNQKELSIFVVSDKGAWKYNGEENTLSKVSDEDIMPYISKQEYVKDASLNLVYVGSNREYSPLHAGSAYQNVYLAAEEKGLGCVVRAYIDKEGLKQALRLRSEEFVIIHQAIGK